MRFPNPLRAGYSPAASSTLPDYVARRTKNLAGSGWASVTDAGRCALQRERFALRPLPAFPCTESDTYLIHANDDDAAGAK